MYSFAYNYPTLSPLVGTLTFALYYLCKHPEAMRKLREEIDEVVGEGTLHLEDVPKLKYMSACLRETLRLNPPATIRVIRSVEDTTIGGGKYAIAKDAILAIITGKCQTDPKVWGEYVSDAWRSIARTGGVH